MVEAAGRSARVELVIGKSTGLLIGLGFAEIGHCLLVQAVDFAAHSFAAVVYQAIQRYC